MNDAAVVRRRHGIDERDRQLEEAIDRKTTRFDQLIERLAVDQLESDEVEAVRFLDRMNGDDVRVVDS